MGFVWLTQVVEVLVVSEFILIFAKASDLNLHTVELEST